MQGVIPGMEARGWGRIINVASAHGLVASSQEAALEPANSGATANAICPGWVMTPLVEKQLRDRAQQNGTDLDTERHQLLAEKQPMSRFTTPEQTGAPAVFLPSDEAETITGAPPSIDGGQVAQ